MNKIKYNYKNLVGVGDSNPRHPAPKAGALPDCAIPRNLSTYVRVGLSHSIEQKLAPTAGKDNTCAID